MKTKIKIIFAKNHIFRLTYRLTVKKGEFFIDIYSEKFEKKFFLSDRPEAPCHIEKITEKLPKMSYSRAVSLFEEISANVVFPSRLSCMIENSADGSDEFLPVI